MKIFLTVLMMTFAVMSTASAEIYRQGVFYVIYDAEGSAAVNKTDVNLNGVPDVVEDIATQLNAARELFNGVFNFPDPLTSERFANVTSIEITFAAKSDMTAPAFAFASVRKNSLHDPNEQSLKIKMSNAVNPHKSSTPAHEYFHLIQFGATYFRNKWFTEGMAQWSEDAVAKMNYPDGRDVALTLESPAAADKLFRSKYAASKLLWYPLAVNMRDKATIPAALIVKYRYVDGTPVFRDNVIYGPNVMREVLRVMKSKEHLAAAEFGDAAKWRQKGQRAVTNNKVMLECVREVYATKR
ncbi:MAG: hypothetical protein SR1Q7_06315 [Quinella sp. 1Q7]|nr:hypothetical protein [Quinella sp. 1Q7]